MRYPVNYIAITVPFKKGKHYGADFGWNSKNGGKNQPIYAVDDGKVIYRQTQTSGGKVLHIKHSNGYVSEYAHLDTWLVKKNAKVKRGQQIGTMGCTGKVSGNHLHFGLYKGTKINYNDGSKWVDPIKYLVKTDDQKVGTTTNKNYDIKEAPYVTKTVIPEVGLNVRNKPSILGKKVGFLKYKTKVKEYETSGSWSRIDYCADEWVSTKYLKKTS
jgi:murein DD-endopeptidase MepM/ murein hydrolase activator NlpD